ncbi:prepronociceptin [Aplochiton taeniatus]
MKTPLLALLFLCLCVPGHCDCQEDCFTCEQLLSKDLNFNTMVCLVECEGDITPAYTWNLCRQVSALEHIPFLSLGGAILKRAQEEAEAMRPEGDQADELVPAALQRFDHVTRALDFDELSLQSRTDLLNTEAAYDSQLPQSVEEEGAVKGGEEQGDATSDGVDLSMSKRFGGFLKGRHGYKKLMTPGRSFQKRYGGFIGVRKSARKWNNQKRFSKFLKQYLGMSTRSSDFKSLSEDFAQQNEV